MQKYLHSALSTDALKHLREIKTADIIVGIPSYNNVLTASFVISQVVKGLGTYFPGMSAVIFVSDGNSVDGTLTSVKSVDLPSKMDLIPAVYVGVSGKGTAVKAIFEAAKYLRVQAVGLVDSDLRSITPEWMRLLLSPVFSGTGLVVPFYNRRKYDGTITNFLCYPLTASLYSRNIRQPIGGDFGLSMELVDELLASPMWRLPDVHTFGVDIFETHTALARGFQVKQAFLGIKEHDPKDPTKQLTSMFRQVIGTMFRCIEYYEPWWRNDRCVTGVDMVGEEKHVNSQPPIQIDLQNMINTYQTHFEPFTYLYKYLLREETFRQFEQLKNLNESPVAFPMETWAETVYRFITAFHSAAPSSRQTIVDALRILWTGRLAAFIQETLPLDAETTERKITDQARAFEKLKPYLLEIYGQKTV